MSLETMEQLKRHLNGVLSKRPGQALGVWGEAGVGKTFTVQALLKDTPCRSLTVSSTASEGGIARALPSPTRLPMWTQRQLERLLGGQHLDAQAALETLAAVLAGLAPFVLHVEDLHEANPERQAWWQRLAQAVKRSRGVVLVVSSRQQPPEPFFNHHLRAFSQVESDALLEAQTGASLPRAGLDWVFAKAQGNALYTLEFWRYLARQGFFWSDGQAWHWRTPPDDFVPLSVEALIVQRLQHVAVPHAQVVLEARALIPNDVDEASRLSVWGSMTDLSSAMLLDVQTQLEVAGLLRQSEFAHPLIREVVLRQLGVPQRTVLARRAFEHFKNKHLESALLFLTDAALDSGQVLEVLEEAVHLAQDAGDPFAEARRLALMVPLLRGEARGRRAFEAARKLKGSDANKALELHRIAWEACPDDLEMACAYARAVAEQGDMEQANRLLESFPESVRASSTWLSTKLLIAYLRYDHAAVLELWNQHPVVQREPLVDVRAVVVMTLMRLDEYARAEALAQAFNADPQVSALERINLLFATGGLIYTQARYAEAITWFEACVETCQQQGRLGHEVRALNMCGNTHRMLRRFDDAIAAFTRAHQLACEVGDFKDIAGSLMGLGTVLLDIGEFERAEQHLLEALPILTRLNYLALLYSCTEHLAVLYLTWKPPYGAVLAVQQARAALQWAQQANSPHMIASALMVNARAEIMSDRWQAALEHADQAAAAMDGADLDHFKPRWHRLRSSIFEHEGQHESAMAELRIGIELAVQHKNPTDQHQLGLQLARLLNDLEAGRTHLAFFEANGMAAVVQEALADWPELSTESVAVVAAEAVSHVQLKVLGTVGLERDGEPFTYRGRKRLEILCYLLEARIAGRLEVGVLELLDVFYPDVPEKEAKLTLRQQVYLIRNDLGQDSVQSTRNGYALGAVDSDAERFFKTRDTSLWQGAYLDQFSAGWNGGVREALLEVLRSEVESLLEVDAVEAKRLGLILSAMEPYDTNDLRLVLRAHQASDDFKAAQRLYREARERLLDVGESLPQRLEEFWPDALLKAG